MPAGVEKPPKKTSERILAFDLMRGYFLFVILMDHLGFYPNGFDFITGRGILYVSTAEGFFVVSGLVLGIVRGRKLLSQPFKHAAWLLWRRALQLYATSIILTLLFTAVGQLFLENPGLKYGVFTDWANWGTLLWQTFTLQYTYGWADFLRLYALFMFLAPGALWLLRKGRWYFVTLISAGLWALYPFIPKETALAQPFSWQFIFFAGFTIGFYWEPLLKKWRSISLATRRKIAWTVAAAFLITAAISFILVLGAQRPGAVGDAIAPIHHAVEKFFDKDRLPIPRILLGAVWFWGLFVLVRRFESTIKKYLGPFLLGFGTHSLYIYTISAFVIFFAHLIVPYPGFHNIFLNFLAAIIVTEIVWLTYKTKFLMNIIPH